MSQLLNSLLTLVGVLAMMLWISPLLALVALVSVPLSIVVTAADRQALAAAVRRAVGADRPAQRAHRGDLHRALRSSGSSGTRRRPRRSSASATRQLYKASYGAQFLSGIILPAIMFIGNLNYVFIAVIGGLRVASGSMSLGDVQAFIQYSRQFSQPLTQVASMSNLLQSGVASAERVFELLDADEQVPDPAAPERLDDPRGRVAFEHVSFRYEPDVPLIDDLSLVAAPGQSVAIVGPTGAGKTTLVNLIMRFYELDGGRITFDGHDIATMRRDDLRGQIGMVLQDAWLFGGTIRDNIAYGRPDATEEEILEAARATFVDRFVHSLPDGYDTVIDDEASNISAGERQLITIARAFLARAVAADPRRGDQLGRHPHRGAGAEGDGRAALRPDELHHRPPALDDPRRRPDPGDGGRPHRRAGHARRAARRAAVPTPRSTTPSSPARSPRRSRSPEPPSAPDLVHPAGG